MPKPKTAGERTDLQAAHGAAVALLARRDFSRAELLSRLCRRGFERATAEAAVSGLAARGLLDEGRFAQNYVTSQAGRGKGPVRIRAELNQQGVAQEFIDAALPGPHDWAGIARKVCRGRFGPRAPESWPEKARQVRFLQYRGFSSDHIRSATGADPDLD